VHANRDAVKYPDCDAIENTNYFAVVHVIVTPKRHTHHLANDQPDVVADDMRILR
jgi:hypothetical protein